MVSILSSISALFCFAIAFYSIVRRPGSLVHLVFGIGMFIFGLESGVIFIGLYGFFLESLLKWEKVRWGMASFLPGLWLLFALIYARINYKAILSKWRYILTATWIVPILFTILFSKSFFKGDPIRVASSWVIPIGWSGYGFHLSFLISGVLILLNLEKTLRESVGSMRWQIKYMVLGVGCIWGIRIYTSSQAILFQSLDTGLLAVETGSLAVGSGLMLIALLRKPSLAVDFYLSPSLFYHSITVLVVGFYLFFVGVFTKVIHHYFNVGREEYYIEAFIIFLGLLGGTILLLSDNLRFAIKRFVTLHLRRPHYDYRQEWAEFTQAMTSLTEMEDISMAIVKRISNTFNTSSVTLWLLDEKKDKLILAASTAFSEKLMKEQDIWEKGLTSLLQAIKEVKSPVDLKDSRERWITDLNAKVPEFLKDARIRYCAPLIVRDRLIGLLTLNDRLGGKSFSIADFELLKTIADQASATFFNLRLTEQVRQAKEREAIQTMSAFLMHDLKNLASLLSLTMENLPTHFDNPEFRKDAFKVVQQSVNQVNRLCSHLSLLSQKIEFKKVETDLNELVVSSLSCLNGSNTVSIFKDLKPLPKLHLDPEQIEKVLANLILNAKEAVGDGGEIRIMTQRADGWAIFSVQDNGCGMSREFMEKSLFRPFKTTKKQGMGIGLFQSKMIIEAHGGKIEVQSEEGKGSTFRVFLPMKRV